MADFLSDGFDFATLCNGVNAAPTSRGPVMNYGLFYEKPTNSVDIAIELNNEQLSLVQSSPRGGVVQPHPITGRSLVKFKATHLRTNSTILAASWQGRTGYGSKGMPAEVAQERDRILAEHRRRLDATIDYHQTRALAGQILDADGSVMVDLLAEFGVVQPTVACALDVASTNVTNRIIAARRQSEAELGTAAASSWVAFCDATFIDALRGHASIEASLAGYTAAALMLADHRKGALVVGGVTFLEVPSRAGRTYIDAGTAYLCPVDVPDLFTTYYAPADYIESVNTEGLPLYSRAEPLDFNRGVSLESQSNPISICSRPKAVIKLTA